MQGQEGEYSRHRELTWVMISFSKETKDNVLWHKICWQTHSCEELAVKNLVHKTTRLVYQTFLKWYTIGCFNLSFCRINFPISLTLVHHSSLFFALLNFNHHPEISTLFLKAAVKGHVTLLKYDTMIGGLMVKE